MKSIFTGNAEGVREWIDSKNGSVDIANWYRITALHLAAQYGFLNLHFNKLNEQRPIYLFRKCEDRRFTH